MGQEELLWLIAVLLGFVILFLIILLLRPRKDDSKEELKQLSLRLEQRDFDLQERNMNFEREHMTQLINFQNSLSHNLNSQFQTLQESVELRLLRNTQSVSGSLEEGFRKSQETFTNIVERLTKIDEAQKKIDALSGEIVSLQNVLSDKKARGAFGEVQLSQILSSIFGAKNNKVYQEQYSLSTGARCDAILFAPEPLGSIVIDSKFPLENYRRMLAEGSSDEFRKQAQRAFVNDCKNHIDTIAQKYIIAGETADQAIMFVPAEAVFANISAYHEDILDYSQKRRVWITSPTTLMSTLTTIQVILKNMDRDQYASIIHQQLKILSLEFSRYNERWQKLANHMDTLSKDFKDINITTDKISRQFERIENVEITD